MLDDLFEKESSHVIKGSSSVDCDASFIQSQNELHLLVRIVDDFLLVSTKKSTSVQFLKKFNKGIPGLGVRINGEKSRVNYPLYMESSGTGNMDPIEVCTNSFQWCGLLIDTRTCEISLDHKRFSGTQSTDAVVIHRAANEGLNFKKKMKDFVRPRCSQRLLFSSCINGIGTICLNFYQTCLLCAVKTLHYMICSGSTSPNHEEFIYNSACDTIRFAFLLISSKLQNGERRTVSSPTKMHMAFQLAWTDALWLGRHAFFSVFQRSGTQHAKLCDLFCQSSRLSNRKDLLAVARQALEMFPLKGRKQL